MLLTLRPAAAVAHRLAAQGEKKAVHTTCVHPPKDTRHPSAGHGHVIQGHTLAQKGCQLVMAHLLHVAWYLACRWPT